MAFRINRKTDYAVRVVLFLARQPSGTRTPTKVVQDETLIPRAYLLRIIAELSKVGIINTHPGPSGGLQMGKPAEDVSLGEILEVMEGSILVSDCLENPEECSLSTNCPVRGRWGCLQRVILKELRRTTIHQLVDELENEVEELMPLE